MTALFGVPLVGKLFVPTLAVAAILFVMVIAMSRWRRSKEPVVENSKLIEPVLEPADGVEEFKAHIPDDQEMPAKKKKKKKSCCGTKGSCCKTKKETGEETGGSCGCGCSSKKKDKVETDENSCSSNASTTEGSDSEEEVSVLDVEDLGRIVEGLRPNLVSTSPSKPARVNGVPIGRVRLRNAIEIPKQQLQLVA